MLSGDRLGKWALATVCVLLSLSEACAQSPFTEDFESESPGDASCGVATGTTLPAGWSNDASNQRDWQVWSGSTPTLDTGPTTDHTSATVTGQYLYLESSCGAVQSDSVFQLPSTDISSLMTPTLTFFRYMSGNGVGSLQVEYRTPGGIWNPVSGTFVSGSQGDRWVPVTVVLTTLAFNNFVDLRFRGSFGNSFRGDIAIDDISIDEPLAVVWQLNSTGSSFDFDGVELQDAYGPFGATSTECAGGMVTVNFGSTYISQPWEVAINIGTTTLGANVTGLVSADGQVVNLDVGVNTVYLNGGNYLFNYQGDFSYPIMADDLVPSASVQMVNFAPPEPDGWILSQAAQLNIVGNTLPGAGTPGPAAEDEGLQWSFGCTPVPFYGTSYTDIYISSNGFISFGSYLVGNSNWTATTANGLSNPPFVGAWSDLSPNTGGSITLSMASNDVLRVDYAGVPYFGEPGTANSFSIEYDTATGTINLGGLAGLVANNVTGAAPAVYDNVFVGISMGSAGATNGGLTDFSVGSGAPFAPTDMIYDHALGGAGLPPSLVAGVNSITFIPMGNSYTWTSP